MARWRCSYVLLSTCALGALAGWESSFKAEQPASASLEEEEKKIVDDLGLPEVDETKHSAESVALVQGLVEGFLHKSELEKGELDCISEGSGVVVGDVVKASEELVLMFDKAIGHADSSSDGHGDKGSSEAGNKAGASDSKEAQAKNQLDFFYGQTNRRLGSFSADAKFLSMAPTVLMEAGVSAAKIVKLTRETAKECLKLDALKALDEAAIHMESVSWVSGHLIANGQDILLEMSNAVKAFKKNDYHQFGRDFGVAMRKVFLSNRTDSKLPEGMPSEEVLVNVSNGIVEGLFGRGAELDLEINEGKHQSPEEMDIDLHQCISENLPFFEQALSEMMFFYKKHDAGVTEQKKESEKASWSGAVAMTLLHLPSAMEKCDLGPEHQEMLEDAIKAAMTKGGNLGVDFQAPKGSNVSTSQMEDNMASTVKDWARMSWSTFGKDVGQLLQEVATKALSDKYTVDNGVLKKRVVSLEADSGETPMELWEGRTTALIGGGILTLGVALFAITAMRTIRTSCEAEQPWSEIGSRSLANLNFSRTREEHAPLPRYSEVIC